MDKNIILELEKIIKKRKESSDTSSYVFNLFSKGKVKIANKLGEEAVETISAFFQNKATNNAHHYNLGHE